MTRLTFAGWLLVVLVAAFTPDWLVGSGSLLGSLLSGSQGNPGYEGIEAVLVLGTLPVLVGIARRDAA